MCRSNALDPENKNEKRKRLPQTRKLARKLAHQKVGTRAGSSANSAKRQKEQKKTLKGRRQRR
jgi:hypothetical protein